METLLPRKFSARDKEFLALFDDSVFAYFDDLQTDEHEDQTLGDTEKDPPRTKLPPIHSDGLDLAKNEMGYGVFFSVNGIQRAGDGILSRTKQDIKTLNGVFVDFDASNYKNFGSDGKEFPLNSYKRMLCEELSSIKTPPTIIVKTKNGVHAYWLFSRPVYLNKCKTPEEEATMRGRWERLEKALVEEQFATLGADPQVKEINRVLRVPGTWHLKDPRDPYLVKIYSLDLTISYTLEELEEAFLDSEQATTSLESWADTFQETTFTKEIDAEIEKIYPRLERPSYQFLMKKMDGAGKGLRNYSLLVVATACRRAGWPLARTLSYFDKYNGLTLAQIEHDIRTAYKRPEPYDFGYNCPALSALVSVEERKKFQEAVTIAFRKVSMDAAGPVVSKLQADHERLLETALDKESQKQQYTIFEFLFQRKYPNIRYEIGGKFFEFKDGFYHPIEEEEIETMMMQEFLLSGLLNFRTRAKVADKVACLKSLPGIAFAPEEADRDPFILNVKNGLLDLRTKTLSEHTPEYIALSRVSFPYDQNADCPRFRQFIKEITLGRTELADLLQKIMGYCLTFNVSHHKAFIFHGAGRNGKGVFTSILSQLIGFDFVSNLGMKEISSNFGLATLYRKKLNVVDEVPSGFFESDVLKKLISGERTMADVKYRTPLVFHPTAKFIFTVNELPRINDQSVGFYERFIVIPFDASFRKNPDTNLGEKLLAEASGILNYAIEGMEKLREAGGFGATKTTDEAAEEFRLSNSSLLEFLTVNYEPDGRGRIPMAQFMREYQTFCRDFGYKAKSLRSLLKEFHFIATTNPEFGSVKATAREVVGLLVKPELMV